ncbi:hypothetical protein Hanom_Chr10g00934181 [Helianthus anomalus]
MLVWFLFQTIYETIFENLKSNINQHKCSPIKNINQIHPNYLHLSLYNNLNMKMQTYSQSPPLPMFHLLSLSTQLFCCFILRPLATSL